jgi:photosynthetic reaction center H subunit
MPTGALTSYFDVAQVVLYAFWIFFALLIICLRREDKREGYPLDSDRGERVKVVGWPPLPAPKTFVMPFGHGTRTAPRHEPPQPVANAAPIAPWPGAPLVPLGDPMLAGVGPGACPTRPDELDLTVDGRPKIIPMRIEPSFSVAKGDPDPRGLTVVGADGVAAGTVTDLWVDTAEPQVRYLEVALSGINPQPEPPGRAPVAETVEGEPVAAAPEPAAAAPNSVLLPINFCVIRAKQGKVKVASINGEHFINVPRLSNPERVTLREEDRITAYYGGGTLYANWKRAEPLL